MTKLNMLVVEDQAELREMLNQGLSAEYVVRTCDSADEAIASIVDGDQRFDIVLTDWKCPGLNDGGRVIAAMRRHRPGTPVIVMTGSHGLEASIRKNHRPDGIIVKPFTPDQVLRFLEESICATQPTPS